jgi:hypothetical protein
MLVHSADALMSKFLFTRFLLRHLKAAMRSAKQIFCIQHKHINSELCAIKNNELLLSTESANAPDLYL